MTSGGHRASSGPAKDPNALRRQRDGYTLRKIPNTPYTGEHPDFPLPDRTYHEASLWEWAWRQPQAHVWATETWRWPIVAMWVRTFVRCCAENAKTADVNSLHRLADQIGMSPAGLKENGWAIAPNEIAERAAEKAETLAADLPANIKDRLKLVTEAS